MAKKISATAINAHSFFRKTLLPRRAQAIEVSGATIEQMIGHTPYTNNAKRVISFFCVRTSAVNGVSAG